MGESPEYSEADFLQCFSQFKQNGKGFITKKEMMIFIKKVAGLQTKDDEDALKRSMQFVDRQWEQIEICPPSFDYCNSY